MNHEIMQIDFKVLRFPPKLRGLKDRYLKSQVTIGDLEKLLELSKRAVEMCEINNSDADLEALTAYIIIIYGRCFNSKFNLPPPQRGLRDELPEGAKEDTLTEAEFHQLLLNYRNGHIAHADDFLKKYEVGGCITGDGQIGIVPLIAARVPIEDRNFYIGVHKVVSKWLTNSQERQKKFFNEIVAYIESGTIIVTDEPLKITPIPSNESPRTMWNLPERNSKK